MIFNKLFYIRYETAPDEALNYTIKLINSKNNEQTGISKADRMQK